GAVFFDQHLAEAGQITFGLVVDEELIRIGPAVVADGDGLAAPDQLRAASAEVPPTSDRVLTRTAVARAVPAFHGLDRKTIADPQIPKLKWCGQGRSGARQQLAVTGNIESQRSDV